MSSFLWWKYDAKNNNLTRTTSSKAKRRRFQDGAEALNRVNLMQRSELFSFCTYVVNGNLILSWWRIEKKGEFGSLTVNKVNPLPLKRRIWCKKLILQTHGLRRFEMGGGMNYKMFLGRCLVTWTSFITILNYLTCVFLLDSRTANLKFNIHH
jgi:hypothetical protein